MAFQLGQYEKAEKSGAVYLKLNPQSIQERETYLESLLKLGKLKLALLELQVLVEASPDPDKHLARMAWVVSTCEDPSLKKNPQQTLLWIQEARKQLPKESNYILIHSAVMADAGEFEQASQLLKEVIDSQMADSRAKEKAKEYLAIYQHQLPLRIKWSSMR